MTAQLTRINGKTPGHYLLDHRPQWESLQRTLEPLGSKSYLQCHGAGEPIFLNWQVTPQGTMMPSEACGG
jgi:hypothetical protein